MSRNKQSLVEYELKKKPEFMNAFKNLQSLSHEDISNLKLPKWIKQYLSETKNNMMAHFRAHEILKNKIEDTFSPEIYGDVRRWTGNTTFINVDRGGSLEVKTDKLLFFPQSGGVWFDTAFSKSIDHRLFYCTLVESNTTKTKYIENYRAQLIKQNPNCSSTTLMDNSKSTAMENLAKLGVRIF